MGLKKSLDRIEYLDYLIRRKCTGTPKELAEKLGISERWLYEILNELKHDFDCPIKYSRRRRSYVYTCSGSLVIEFMNKEEQSDLNAGFKIISSFSEFFSFTAV
ncbi:MAG: hypothetical protein JJ953_14580 [Gracilimonas sp.]|uniref:hypothetical protein n=1 Tax=Gracilimonas TaxID=649462 RepID=UPI001B21B941|nr:hypothetical protein [Gracilimonas sp.]MBO6587334.1 hypothetical protein [Gracilimonas sp.]